MSERFEPGTTAAERHEPAPRVFVEVGTNQLPVSFMGTKKFGEKEKYIGFDIKRGEVIDAREAHGIADGGDNAHFVQGSGERLPMKDESADELLFGNVFGDPSLPASKAKLLDEAERVLKVGGQLTIKETNTPFDLEKMRALLAGRPFLEDCVVTPEGESWEREIQNYEKIKLFASEDAYLMYLRKIAEAAH